MKFAFGFAAAVVLSFASLGAPASAATTTKTNIVAPMTDVSSFALGLRFPEG
jgi:hypothetical protein